MTFPNLKHKHKEESLFSPTDWVRYKNLPKKIAKSLPTKYIIIYRPRVLEYFKKKYHPKEIEIHSNLKIQKIGNVGVVKMTGIGSPHAATAMEELIALGGGEFLNIGTSGGLQKQGIYLCEKALRDEGTSYHYLPHGDFIYPDKELTKKLGEQLEKRKIKYLLGATWTIDAPYRETKKEVEKYRKSGISTVEMEASALFAVAKVRKVKIAAAFVVSDLLGKTWLPRFHRFDVKKAQNKLIDAAVECLK